MTRRGTPEADLQRAVVRALRQILPRTAIVHHCANEVTEAGPRGAKRQAILVGMGVHAGFADLMILSDGRVLFLELKSLNGRLRPTQEAFRDAVLAQGFGWALVRSLDDALTALADHGFAKDPCPRTFKQRPPFGVHVRPTIKQIPGQSISYRKHGQVYRLEPKTGIHFLPPRQLSCVTHLGADVIKVERAGEGDDTRRWGPPFLKDKDGNPTREAGYYLSVNRGKRSVELDLKSEAGRAAVKALAAESDILLENFKTGTLDRMGLGYEDLKAVNPKLVYCSVTGFGLTGPTAKDAAYDFMIQGMGGLMSVTGGADGAPGGGPQKVGVPIVDIMTGMYAAIGVLAALSNRDQTGKGDHIDLAMLDVSVAMLANQAMNYLVSGEEPVRRGNSHPNIQPQNVYPVKDGFIVLAVGNDGQFRKFADAIGRPALADDPKFATNAARVENLPELETLLIEALASGTITEWITTFAAAGVPSGPINTVGRVFDEPQVQHRQMLRDIPHPLAGQLKQVVSPLNFRNAPLAFDKAPPLLGQHTDEVLGALGLKETQQ